jgi:starch synthase
MILTGSSMEEGTVWSVKTSNYIEFIFIENDKFFYRDELYGDTSGDYPDNLERFVFFSNVVLQVIKNMDWKPDIIHCHDWQTALIPAYIKTTMKEDFFYQGIKTVITIHNLSYQGIFQKEQFPITGMGWICLSLISWNIMTN